MVAEPHAPPLWRRSLTLAGLALLGIAVLFVSRRHSVPELVLADECIYVVGTRNVLERGTLNTNYYLASSMMRLGYPHRDVHMPGYILALSPFVALLGPRLEAAVALNALAYIGSIALLFRIGERLLGDTSKAALIAALFALLPPFPAYLWVAFPEHLVAFALLAGIAWLLRPGGGGTAHAAVAGVLLGLGLLLRESLLAALPLYLLLIRPRALLRGFAPGLVATLAAVVLPLSRNRAVHDNGLFPGILEEAAGTERPLLTLGAAIWENLAENLRLTIEARPLSNPEDLSLAVTALLAVAAAVAAALHRGNRRFALGVLASLALLVAAVLSLYVVRVRGGVWGGVRAFMPWGPLLLVVAAPLLTRWRAAARLAATLPVALAFLAVDGRQLEFYRHYKAAEREDQQRLDAVLSRWVDKHHPHRVVGPLFSYGVTRYPVEVVWKFPRTYRELERFAERFPFEYYVVHGRSRAREAARLSARFVRVNRQERRPEWVVWRRVY